MNGSLKRRRIPSLQEILDGPSPSPNPGDLLEQARAIADDPHLNAAERDARLWAEVQRHRDRFSPGVLGELDKRGDRWRAFAEDLTAVARNPDAWPMDAGALVRGLGTGWQPEHGALRRASDAERDITEFGKGLRAELGDTAAGAAEGGALFFQALGGVPGAVEDQEALAERARAWGHEFPREPGVLNAIAYHAGRALPHLALAPLGALGKTPAMLARVADAVGSVLDAYEQEVQRRRQAGDNPDAARTGALAPAALDAVVNLGTRRVIGRAVPEAPDPLAAFFRREAVGAAAGQAGRAARDAYAAGR